LEFLVQALLPGTNPNRPADARTVAARMALANQHISKTLPARITELADGGLDLFEIQSVTGIALPLIRLVLRGATPGVPK
jgi:hypothetical protein